MRGSIPDRHRRIVIVGIPGVGKSTVVARVVELLRERARNTQVVNYGSIMLEEASKILGLKSRDEMRKLSIEAQRNLQVHAASTISRIDDEVVIVDTHLFISTNEGFWPGMPMDVLQALKPTNLVLVTAKPEEILSRRQKDTTRSRDPATKESLIKELQAAHSLLYASSIITGCPALVVDNPEGPVDPAALRIMEALT
jgi:adenylate kinase